MADPQITSFLKGLAMARNRFLYGLDKVPDDRLNWTPGGSAKSALQLAGRLTGFMSMFAGAIKTGEFARPTGEAPPAPETRDAAKAAVEGAFARVREGVSGLSGADLERDLTAPWGPMKLRDLLGGVQSVGGYAQGQLNYLQLCYGDEDPNMPPNWGQEEA
jgi:hypothetical protein